MQNVNNLRTVSLIISLGCISDVMNKVLMHLRMNNAIAYSELLA